MAPPQSQPNQPPAPRAWNPPPRSTAFVGRQDELARLAELLRQYPRVAIVATGGMGKTAVAAEALFELARSTDPEVPVPHTIYSHDYYRQPAHANALAGLLAQAGVDQRGLPDLTGAVKSLFSQPRVLLYLEGCEKAEQLTHLLELVGDARVLLTSREKKKCGDAHPFELGGLQPEDAAQLLHHHAQSNPLPTDRAVRQSWLDLAKKLGRHPLALCLAGRWMHNQQQTPVEFATGLQTELFGDWSEEDQEKANLHRLFAHSADAIAERHPRALEAWYALALHAHAPIYLPALRGALGDEEKELRSALAALVNYCLAEPHKFPSEQEGQTEPAWQLTHALLGEWGRDHLSNSRREEALISSPQAAEQAEDLDGASSRRLLSERGEAILRDWFDWWKQDLRMCFAAGAVPGGPLRYQALQPHWDALLRASESHHGKDSRELANYLNWCALIHHAMGNYATSELLHRRAFNIRELTFGPEHPDTLMSLNNLASLLMDKGDLASAEPLYRRALEACERLLGQEQLPTLTTISNLALLLRRKGDLAGAEAMYRRTLEACERLLGREHRSTLTSVISLAELLREKGDLAGAEPLHRRALEACERLLGHEHPSTLTSLNNLALLLHAKGDLAGAESLHSRELKACERVLGREHPNTLTSVMNLAMLFVAKGDLAGAESLVKRAERGFFARLGPEHPHTKRAQQELADLRELRAAQTSGK